MPLYVEMAVIVFNMADEPPVSVNRELERRIIEIVVILDNNARKFSVEDADFVLPIVDLINCGERFSKRIGYRRLCQRASGP